MNIHKKYKVLKSHIKSDFLENLENKRTKYKKIKSFKNKVCSGYTRKTKKNLYTINFIQNYCYTLHFLLLLNQSAKKS